jgi:hypothetical protein
VSLTSLLPSWELALESDNKSPKTIKPYLASVRSLTAYLAANDMPAGIDDVSAEGIRAGGVLRARPVRRRGTVRRRHDTANRGCWWQNRSRLRSMPTLAGVRRGSGS